MNFNIIAEKEYNATLLHFTDSELFNKDIKLLTERKEMYLNKFKL